MLMIKNKPLYFSYYRNITHSYYRNITHQSTVIIVMLHTIFRHVTHHISSCYTPYFVMLHTI